MQDQTPPFHPLPALSLFRRFNRGMYAHASRQQSEKQLRESTKARRLSNERLSPSTTMTTTVGTKNVIRWHCAPGSLALVAPLARTRWHIVYRAAGTWRCAAHSRLLSNYANAFPFLSSPTFFSFSLLFFPFERAYLPISVAGPIRRK